MKNCIIITLCIFFIVSVTACSRRNEAVHESSSLPSESELVSMPVQSSASEAYPNSEIEEEPPIEESSGKPSGEWPEGWPDKYKTYDKYLVAQPKHASIKTYIYDTEKNDYDIIDSPIPDYMITLNDYLIPILEKYEKVEIDRIVFDDSQKKVCVNFNTDYAALYASDETSNNEILYSIAKTIIENYSLEFDGVYFEIDMKPFMEPDIA